MRQRNLKLRTYKGKEVISINKRVSLGASVALGAILMSVSAGAQVSITYPGPGGFGQNVLFTNNPPDGFHVVGILNSNGTFNVNFDSTTDFMHGNGGQARIDPVSPDLRLNSACVSLDPGFGFTEYIFNGFRNGKKGPVPLTVTAFWVGGPVGGFSSTFNINTGSNFVDVLADPGFLLMEVCFSTPDLPDTSTTEYGLEDLRQNRIIGAQAITGVVPEGQSLSLLMAGLLPLGFAVRRKACMGRHVS